MGITMAALTPILLSMGGYAATRGVQSMFGGSDIEDISGFPLNQGDITDPRILMEQYLKDVGQVGAIQAQRAAAPVTLPGAFAQPLPWYGGGGLPMPIGVTAQDPALFTPGTYQSRAGATFAEPDYAQLQDWPGGAAEGYWDTEAKGDDPTQPYHKVGAQSTAPETVGRWMFGEYAPRRDLNVPDVRRGTQAAWGELDQAPSGQIQVGGGVPQLKANLELMGVTTNPYTGAFEMNTGRVANQELFAGARPWNPRGGQLPSQVPNVPQQPTTMGFPGTSAEKGYAS